jgi:glycogen debranching enzyme
LFTKNPPEAQAAKRFEHRAVDDAILSLTRSREQEARAFGASVPWEEWTGTDTDLTVRCAVDLAPGEEQVLSFALAFSPEGAAKAHASLRLNLDAPRRLAESRRVMEDLLSSVEVLTPEPLINRATQWSKVNMLRVQHRYRSGTAFTNDPPQDIVVIRDVGWYLLGSDYVTPAFSQAMISFVEKYGYHDGGKLTEYLHANEERPAQHDYRLNINDDTPLFVWALAHHALTAGGAYGPERVYPLMRRACDWILRQRGEDGLVECGSVGTDVWGICGWRNIIADYTLSGAVTEVNAECVLALRETAAIAAALGKRDEADAYALAAQSLSDRMNALLRSEHTGLYLLNRTVDGTRRHDVTGDEIFPVLCGTADEETSGRILTRLTAGDLWTSHGARTIPPGDPLYDPDAGYQLVGGVWPNLTAWIAYGLRDRSPSALVEGMRTLGLLLEPERPRAGGHVVPGQFPERLHGTTFASRGMTLSPWMPPTYIWLAIEGLLGIRATPEGLVFSPALPPEWEWACVRRLHFRSESVSVLFYRGEVFSTHPLLTNLPVTIAREVETFSSQGLSLAFLADGEVILFHSSEGDLPDPVIVRLPEGGEMSITVGNRSGSPVLLHVPLGRKESP